MGQFSPEGLVDRGRVYVRGIRKVRFHLMSGVVCLAAVKILHFLIIPQREVTAA